MIRRPLVFIACLFLIIALILMKLHPIRGNPPDVPDNSLITVSGKLSDRQYKNDSFIIILDSAAPEKGDPDKTSVFIYLKEQYDSLADLPPIGARVTVRGRFSLFEEASNPGQFDMRRYYLIRGIDYRLFDGEIISYSKRYDVLREKLFSLRCSLGAVYDRLLNEKDSGILKAMILGDRTALDPGIKELYQSAGIAHALSISGLHISILGYGLYRLLRKLRLNPVAASLSCMLFISLYSLMAGAGTATVRAAIMFGTCMVSDLVHRTYDLLSALALSLMTILFTDPLYIFDSGFMLSFGAVAGIALISPVLKKSLPFGEKKLMSGFAASLSINLFTLPVVLYFFYEIPVYSLLINLLVIPCMGVLVVSAVLTAFSGLFLTIPAMLPALICHLILLFYERGCLICQSFPGAVFTAGRPETAGIVIYYTLLFLFCILWKRKKSGKREEKPSVSFLPLLMLLPLILLLHFPRGLNYTMLDIGQGDCNIISDRRMKTVMIDCGSSSVKEIAKYRVLPYLKYMGIREIEAVILTHTDNDHICGFLEILDMGNRGGLRIKNLILPEIDEPDEKYGDIVRSAEEAGIKVSKICAGRGFSIGELDFGCLGPGKGFYASDPNEYSAVVEMKYGDFSALFTGDTQGEGEKQMIEKLSEKDRITVLKVSHHGSRNSTPEEFLRKIRPDASLISSGRKNSYGHPHKELLKRLENIHSDIFCTAYAGAITVRSDGKETKIKQYLKQKEERKNEKSFN